MINAGVHRRVVRATVGFGMLVASAAAVVVSAPTAAACVHGYIEVSSDTVKVGSTVTLSVTTTCLQFFSPVHFEDNGAELTGSPARPEEAGQPGSFQGIAKLSWTPKTAGEHKIVAWQEDQPAEKRTVTITVAPGSSLPNTGSGF